MRVIRACRRCAARSRRDASRCRRTPPATWCACCACGAGDACVLFNGDGRDYDARIVSRRQARRRASKSIGARGAQRIAAARSRWCRASPAARRWTWILQKATELGVAGIVPVHGERSEVRLDAERADKRLRHWRSVVASACEQSGRARMPDVAAPRALADALSALPSLRLLLDPDATQPLPSDVGDDGCALAIGPEGGWSAARPATLHGAGFAGARLGPRMLRTETAGLAAIAALQARAGDFL